MNKSSSLYYFFRKSPLLRALFWVIFVVIFVVVSVILRVKVKQIPEITSINPPIGSPGDLIIIEGKNFGPLRDTSYVEFGGSRLTSSSYLSWKDDEIKVILPPNVRDGLVIVGIKEMRSKPSFFANSTSVPVRITENVQLTIPIITGISGDSIYPGSLITISGSNFGNSRDNAGVFFSADREPFSKDEEDISDNFEYVEADGNFFDYEYWSDSEIRLRVPDGAVSGKVFVRTSRGQSGSREIKISRKAGTKSLISPKTYVVQLLCDVEDSSGDKDSSIILRVPRPYTCVSQPSVQLVEANPEPVIPDFQNTIIHQMQGGRNSFGKKRFTQNFAVTVYETRTSVIASQLEPSKNISRPLFNRGTQKDACVPSGNEEIKNLLYKIIKKETNPYNIAVLCYNYMITNYKIIQNVRSGNNSPLDMLDSKKGDAYDFTMIYTALLRAAGIPALSDSGILVSPDLRTKSHWWTEIYFSGFGWFPVDIALGAGLEYQNWLKDIVPSKFYFGNLDSQHILISRGWNEIKPSASENQTVSRPRSYALQSIWEEASGKTIKYSSYWADPVVIGVY